MHEQEDDKYKNFTNYPKTLTEIRAEKAGRAIGTPRDALISLLRDIDEGIIEPSSLVIVFDTPKDEGDERASTWYIAAVKGFHKAIGIMDRARWLMHQG